MTETETPPPPAARRSKRRYVQAAVALLALALVVALALAYNARRTLARDALVGWLQARGIESQVEFDAVGLGGIDGRLRIGPAADPDVVAELAEVRYGFTGFWNRQPLGVRVTSVRLVRPVVKASFKGGKLSLGSLDPLVEEFSKRPPQPERGQPTILVERGRLALDTDYGRMSATADARLDDGRLTRLEARVSPAELRGRGLTASLGEMQLRAATTGGRFDLLVRGPVKALAFGEVAARDARLEFDAQAPYPDFKRQRGDGQVFLRLRADGKALGVGESRLTDATLQARFEGTSAGWLETLVLSGDGSAVLTGGGAQAMGLDAAGLRVRANATDLTWSRKGDDTLAAQVWTEANVGSAEAGDLRLRDARTVIAGPVGLKAGALSLALRGRADGRGAWAGLGAAGRADPPETVALKRAVSDFRFEAPAFDVALSKGLVTAGLGAPLRVRTASGGEGVLTPVAGRPLFQDGAGAFRVTAKGGGLPTVDLAVDRYAVADGATTAAIRLKGRGGLGPVVDGSVDTAGQFRLSGAAASFTASRCTPVTLTRLEMGENDVEAAAGEICPTGAPLFTFADGAWRIRGQAKGFSANVPFLEARVTQAAGPVDLGAKGEALRIQAEIRTARIEDTAAERRFNPVLASGQARLAGGVWQAGFAVTDPQGRKLGDGRLTQDPAGRGRLDFDTGLLAFQEGGLQPAELSPLAELVASPAIGRVRFVGEMAWTPETATSGGKLSVERLDFRSPAGPVVGLSGDVTFTSLVPLIAAPGQVLRAERIETAAPLTSAELTFGLGEKALRVEGARFAVEGGTLTLEPFEIPLEPNPTWGGVIDFQGVQVKNLVAASPFGDRMSLEAKLTGRVPFQVTPQGVRVTAGRLYAVEPGRLSIRREALTGVQAEGALAAPAAPGAPVPEAPPNTFTEFAYQAMEHLAFDQLEADINSLDGGRLGVLFKIKGEHSPPQKQEIRLTLMEVIRKSYLEKTLPLPSGTKVDLTLDTTVNLDELLKDFADYQSLRGSQAVQP